MGRDLGILLALIVLGAPWRLYSAVTRRDSGGRRVVRATLRPSWWRSGRSCLDQFTNGYVHDVIRHLWHVEEPAIQANTPVVHDNRYADVVTGGTPPRTWTVAKTWIPMRFGESALVGTRT